MNFTKNILLMTSFRVISLLLSIVFSVIITRYLGPTGKGEIAFLFAISSTIWMILDLGTHKTLSYQISKNKNKIKYLTTFSVFSFFLNFTLVIIILYLFQPKIILDVNSKSLFFCLPLFIAVTKFSFDMNFLMIGTNDIVLTSIFKVLPIITNIIIIIFLKSLLLKNKVFTVFYYITLSTTLWTFFSFFVFIRKYNINMKIKLNVVKTTYKLGFKAFLSSLFIFLLIKFDIIFIKHFLSFRELGLYSLAAGFVTMIQTFSNLTGNLLIPKFIKDGDEKTKNQTLRFVTQLYVIIIFFISLGFIFFGKYFVIYLYGKEFTESYKVYLFLIPGTIALSAASFLNNLLWSKGFPIISIVIPLFALLTNILLNIFLIPSIGIIGAALSTSISYLLWWILMLIVYKNKYDISVANLLFLKEDYYFYKYLFNKKIFNLQK